MGQLNVPTIGDALFKKFRKNKKALALNFDLTNSLFADTISDYQRKGAKMNLDEYQRLAMRTAPIGTYTEREIFENACLGLIGETGEVSDLIKKSRFQGHQLGVVHLMRELGDVLWYVALGVYAIKGDYGLEDAVDEAADFMNIPLEMSATAVIFLMTDTIATLANHCYVNKDAIPLFGRMIQYIEALAIRYGSTLEAVMKANVAKLEERYPGAKFDSERSIHRKAGDI